MKFPWNLTKMELQKFLTTLMRLTILQRQALLLQFTVQMKQEPHQNFPQESLYHQSQIFLLVSAYPVQQGKLTCRLVSAYLRSRDLPSPPGSPQMKTLGPMPVKTTVCLCLTSPGKSKLEKTRGLWSAWRLSVSSVWRSAVAECRSF